MNAPLLIQPDAGGRISGGYLYNETMRKHGAWDVLSVEPNQLSNVQIPAATPLVLVDSIWLTPEYLPKLAHLRSKQTALGVVLHSLPSLIEATEAEQPVPAGPTTFEKEALAQLDLMVAVGPHFPALFPQVPVIIASPGMDERWRCAPRARDGECRLVSVGAVSPRKGFAEVAQALATRSPRSPWRWDIVGSDEVAPDYAARLKETTRSLNASVVFHGQLAPEKTREMVQRADLLVMPSFDENHPLVLLEAMSASTPAVAYAAGAARSMIVHGEQGLISDVGDRGLLGLHLCRLIEDEPLRRQMAEACWKAQASLPSWSNSAARTRKQLEQFATSYGT